MYSTNEIIGWLEKTGVPGENHRPDTSHWQTLSHNVVSSTPRLSGIRTHNFSGDSTDCTGSCKSNYHAIMITTAPGSDKSNWWVPRSEQELFIVPEFTSGFSGVRVDRSLIFCILFCTSLCVLFLLAIVLSVVRFKLIIASVIIDFQTFLTTNWFFYKKN